jgi:hypothetical protein
MQKIATRIFIYSSIAFGIIGILIILTLPGSDSRETEPYFYIILVKLLFTTVFIILPSFALSVASKYLNGKS